MNMRHRLLLLSAGLLAGAASMCCLSPASTRREAHARSIAADVNPPVKSDAHSLGGTNAVANAPAFTATGTGLLAPRARTAANGSPEAMRAQAVLLADSGRANTAHRAPGDRFTARDVIVDYDGTEHVRMDRDYRGLPVVGGDLVVHSRRGVLMGVSGGLQTSKRPLLEPRLPVADAISAATADFGGRILHIANKGLCVYGMDDMPALAYEIDLQGRSGQHGDAMMRYFVDAHTGVLLNKWNEVDAAAAIGVGHSLFLRDVPINSDSEANGDYRLVDLTRGSGFTRNGLGNLVLDIINKAVVMRTGGSNIWGNYSESDLRSAGSDVQYGVSKTWDYYKSNFARSGVYNDGVGVKALVDVKYLLPDGVTTTGANAAWYGAPYDTVTFGVGNAFYNPFVSIDITAHELTHGVTDATANFVNTGESAFLNEATSDIMGAMVEFYAGNPGDPGDFYIGEKLDRLGGFLRSMSTPSADLYSADCQYPLVSGTGSPYNNSHARSGIGNHFFYLLAEGTATKTFDGMEHATKTCLSTDTRIAHGTTALTGIGRKAAQTIWYRALTVYMTSTTNYAGARVATLRAAADLYGSGSVNYNAVAKAWTAVKVN
jgi:zinc metalloprotease ZmpA